MTTTRWTLVVSQDTDQALRQVLADEGHDDDGGLSRFVEDAVRARIVAIQAEAAKRANTSRTGAEIDDAVGEALEWARRR